MDMKQKKFNFKTVHEYKRKTIYMIVSLQLHIYIHIYSQLRMKTKTMVKPSLQKLCFGG
jgi:hypothetical protein